MTVCEESRILISTRCAIVSHTHSVMAIAVPSITVLVLCFGLVCAYDYCHDVNVGPKKLLCLGVEEHVLHFGAGYGCLYKPSCSIILSGRKLYRNSTWFKVYIPVPAQDTRTDVWFMITKNEVNLAQESESSRRLGVRETMIAKGEVLKNRTMNVYSYRMVNEKKVLTSSSFFSFAPDRASSRLIEGWGPMNYTVFSWRASEYLIEGSETFNYHKTPVQITLRLVTRSSGEESVTLIQTVKHLIFVDAAEQQPSGQISVSFRAREEL